MPHIKPPISDTAAPRNAAAAHTQTAPKKGFTLIELIVVIAIIAILAIAVILALNPAEILKQSRDAVRYSDMATLKSAIALYLEDVSSPNLAQSAFGYSACYVSTPSGTGTSTARCGFFNTVGATVNASTSQTNYRKIDDMGWIPVRFQDITSRAPFGELPIDPVNNSAYYYAYAATSTLQFELGTFFESQKYIAKNGSTTYTTGTNFAL